MREAEMTAVNQVPPSTPSRSVVQGQIISGAGHLLVMERPALLAEALFRDNQQQEAKRLT